MGPLPGSLTTTTAIADRLIVGSVGRAHGIRGALLIRCADPQTTALRQVSLVYLGDEPAGRKVKSAQPSNGGLILNLEGVADRTAAEALQGLSVAVARADLPAPDPGEFYVADLVGLDATDSQGAPLGQVASLLETGAVPVLQLLGGPEGELLVPFAEPFLVEVDPPKRRLVLKKPDMD